MFNKPILFLIFNRIETTKSVFESIKDIKPKRIYISSDGPRNSEEKIIVEDVRKYVLDSIDWDCEVKTLFRENNLGCKLAVSSAIDWFFQNEEDGIILEDDCLANRDFFIFCEAMLNLYKDDKNIGMISGNNFLFNKFEVLDSYYFSKFFHIWGWATWKRAWSLYDIKMKNWPVFKSSDKFKRIIPNVLHRCYWSNIFDDCYNDKINTWDYQWFFCGLEHEMLGIVPSKNLVSNIGFGGLSTHTGKSGSVFDKMKTFNLGFPIKNPVLIKRNNVFDEYIQKNNFSWFKMFVKKNIPKRIIIFLKKII